jgi:hypothetical protein
VSAGHLDDGELIRLLDGECSFEEQARITSHLATCATCTQRHQELVGLTQAVTAALVRGDQPARSARPPKPRWHLDAFRAAAVLLAVSVGVAAATTHPVRAWLSARWADLRATVGSPAPSGTDSPGTTTVRFVPATSTFTIELVARQDAGVLTIDLSADTIASATVTSGGRGEELVVLPEGLRIVNRPDDKSSYDVRLPGRVTQVMVRIAGAPEPRLVTTRPWIIKLNEQEP